MGKISRCVLAVCSDVADETTGRVTAHKVVAVVGAAAAAAVTRSAATVATNSDTSHGSAPANRPEASLLGHLRQRIRILLERWARAVWLPCRIAVENGDVDMFLTRFLCYYCLVSCQFEYIIISSGQPRGFMLEVPVRLNDMQRSYSLFNILCSRSFVPKMWNLFIRCWAAERLFISFSAFVRMLVTSWNYIFGDVPIDRCFTEIKCWINCL